MTRIFGGIALAFLLGLSASSAAEPLRELPWDAMIGPADPARNTKPKDYLPNVPRSDAPTPQAFMAAREGQWMSGPSIQYDPNAHRAVVPDLDGQRVRIAGYVVPLNFDGFKVREFLLVPYVGGCIHVAAPPANQIVYMKSVEPFSVNADFEPVYVTGTVKTAHLATGVAIAGYTMELETLDFRKE